MKDSQTYLLEFEKKGYFKIKNFFSKDFIKRMCNEIDLAKNVEKYFDKNKKLRRIEKLFDKGDNLNKLNYELLNFLSKLFNKKFVIFKDKFNTKPVGGEGFEAHYDGIFIFRKKNNSKFMGWYEYSNFFVNVLVAFDECNEQNGALEVAKADHLTFEELLKNTKNDGTPKLNKEYASKLKFNRIDLNKGDVLFFSNLCPHKSKKNLSNLDRRILYYTYAESNNPDIYTKYFEDKSDSVSSKGGAL
tara:strand:+ start:236 stop:970 length:735 start_codon:yes stop_codon:yes gene_type:complete